jgi:hypothetical protein
VKEEWRVVEREREREFVKRKRKKKNATKKSLASADEKEETPAPSHKDESFLYSLPSVFPSSVHSRLSSSLIPACRRRSKRQKRG